MGDRDNQGGDNHEVTDEIDAQYQTDNKTGGSAILYGLLALVVTLIVAAGLFFGGRAVYRALTGTGGSDDVTEQEEQANGTEESSGQEGPSAGDQTTPGISDGSDDTDGQTGTNGLDEDIPSTGDDLPATGSPTGI